LQPSTVRQLICAACDNNATGRNVQAAFGNVVPGRQIDRGLFVVKLDRHRHLHIASRINYHDVRRDFDTASTIFVGHVLWDEWLDFVVHQVKVMVVCEDCVVVGGYRACAAA